MSAPADGSVISGAGSEGLGEVSVPTIAGIASGADGWLARPFAPTLSRGTADRGEDIRADEIVAEKWPTAKVLVIADDGRVAVDSTGDRIGLRLVGSGGFGDRPPAGAVLLGAVGDTHVWAVPGDVPEQSDGPSDGWGRTGGGLRQWGEVLDDTDAGLLTSAVALLAWHRSAPFCPRCGAANTPTMAGWARICPQRHLEFPRTDPAVIVVVHDGADRAVLARQSSWPANRYSVLAGFTEAGESLEATVIREIREEIGVDVTDVRYLGSQPWPFPRSLMVGFAARAEPGAELRPRPGEIEAAQWVTRAEIQALLADEDSRTDLVLPGKISIARHMLELWAAG